MVDSPCVKRCTLDADGICEGCFRMLDEIAAWPMADEALRREIVAAAARRAAAGRDRRLDPACGRT
jgi:predicted Fe-S protein YdhL (DUF1289 family)